MSQDPNLFSAFKRPRETLSGIPTASQSSNFSSIPQPASALRRSNSKSRPPASSSRMSLAPPATYSRPSDADLMATARRDPRSARQSYAPSSSQPPPSTARRSSVMRRSSVGGAALGALNSFFTSSTSAIPQRDPRPVKDRSFQAKIGQEIHEYLLTNGFELEAGHSLTPTALKSPTQKDFTMIFQWLYHRLDPNYRFQKPIEQEAPPILKALRYPFAQSITKSQLTAVGSANSWPSFLAMLHWMLELIVTVERYQSGAYDDAAAAEGIDVGADRIIFRYLVSCYRAWLAGDDDHDEFLEEMSSAFDERAETYTTELARLDDENAALRAQLAALHDGEEPLKKVEDSRTLIETDTKKFLDYCSRIEARIAKITATNAKLRDEITASDAELLAAEEEKAALQAAVDRQGLTPADIDRMTTERDKLTKGLSAISARVGETRQKLAEREGAATSALEALERAVARYNTLAYQIGLVPASAPNAGGREFEIVVAPLAGGEEARLLVADAAAAAAGTTVGWQAGAVVGGGRDLRHEVRPALMELRREIAGRIHEAQDEGIRTQEAIDRVTEALAEKADEVDTLHARVQSAVGEYQEIKDNIAVEGNASNAEIEKLEKELAGMRVGMREGVLAVEQRVQGVMIERDQLAHAAQALRERFHGEVDRILNDIIKFKVHIQDTLQSYEQLVEGELRGNDALLEG
ncbi:HEC/Ndc80p family-domain-containing protein [Morchella snyderi]|nr:HEC/Ndc80p family-domain-containing protein [Morchella snyderi]